MLERIRKALTSRRFNTLNEDELQRAIAQVFDEEGIPFMREFALSAQDRLDFAVPHGIDFYASGPSIIAVEVKVDGGLNALTRQLHRYAQHEHVVALAVVTTRAAHQAVARTLNGKQVELISLLGGAL